MFAVKLVAEAIGIGAAAGVGVSLVGVWLLRLCDDRGWVTETWRQMPVITMALVCFAAAQQFGGSGFIAAFVGGLLFGASATTSQTLPPAGRGELRRRLGPAHLGAFRGRGDPHSDWPLHLAGGAVLPAQPDRRADAARVHLAYWSGTEVREKLFHGMVRTSRFGQYRVSGDRAGRTVSGRLHHGHDRHLHHPAEHCRPRAQRQAPGGHVGQDESPGEA